jgi:hypothetical protein
MINAVLCGSHPILPATPVCSKAGQTAMMVCEVVGSQIKAEARP